MYTIAHCLIWYLQPTMGYRYDQLMALGPERSIVLANHPVEPERFPFDRIYIFPKPVDSACCSAGARLVAPPLHALWRPILKKERVGLLHVHDGRLAPLFLPVARRLGLPIVTTFLGYDVSAGLNDEFYLNALRLLFSQGDLFTVMSRDMAGQLRRLGCPEQKIRVIHHGIPLSRFPFEPRVAPDDGSVTILTVGRLIPKKGPTDLARAFVSVCRTHPAARLRVAGDGPLRAEMEAILAEGGVLERAKFLGVLTPDQVAAEMSSAHLFCLPSRVGPDGDSEGIPNVLKEAMACGMPVLSTYHAGIPELVDDGVSGYLVPEGDVDGLVHGLCRLIEEPNRWESMGRAGRKRVEAEFSLSAVVRQLDDEVYAPLLGRAQSAPGDLVLAGPGNNPGGSYWEGGR